MRIQKYMMALVAILSVIFFTSTVMAGPTVNGSGANGTAVNACSSTDNVCWPRVYNTYDGVRNIANDDGVRVTIFSIDDNGSVIDIVGHGDFSNKNHDGYGYIVSNYGLNFNNKYFYASAGYTDRMILHLGEDNSYGNLVPVIELPWVVRASDGANNMEAVKEYFSREPNIKGIADILNQKGVSITYEELTSRHDNGIGKYKLLLEPIAYVQLRFNNLYYSVAVTPTEMAMFDATDNFKMFYDSARNMMYSTFAKGMFLTNDDLGFRAYTPSGSVQSIDTVKNYLGLAIVSFGDNVVRYHANGGSTNAPTDPIAHAKGEAIDVSYSCSKSGETFLGWSEDGENVITSLTMPDHDVDLYCTYGSVDPTPGGSDSSATYRYDTDVISSTYLTSPTDRAHGNEVQVTFTLASTGQTLCNKSYEAAAGKPQLVYCQWHTPTKSAIRTASDTITVRADGVRIGSIAVTYQEIYGKEPPDTRADDTRPNSWSEPRNIRETSLNSPDHSSNTWQMWYSENGHKDGKLQGVTQTFTGMGSDVNILYYKVYNRDWISSGYWTSCGSGETYVAHCSWVDTSHWGSWYQVNEVETVVKNEASRYMFYRYLDYGYTSRITGNYSAGGTGNWKYEGYYTEYTAQNDVTRPYINTYQTTLSVVNAAIAPDPNGDPTATNTEMKSGYGIISNANVTYSTTCSGKSYAQKACTMYMDNLTTSLQHVVATFPEFEYKKYQRVLDVISGNFTFSGVGTKSQTYEFAKNKYDIGNERTHFTPIWYPDNTKYIVKFRFMDLWTPAGHIEKYKVDDHITINGDIFDDWAIVIN